MGNVGGEISRWFLPLDTDPGLAKPHITIRELVGPICQSLTNGTPFP